DLWKNCVLVCKHRVGTELRRAPRNSRWKKSSCAWWADHGPRSRNSPGWRNGGSGFESAVDDFAPFALRMQSPQRRQQSPVRPDRHRPQRIFEGGAAVTTNFITMPIDGEHPAHIAVVTTKRKFEHAGQRVRETVPQRTFFRPRHSTTSTVHFSVARRIQIPV